ncbi:histidinol dehydrogenase [Candidatus Woesearchaeota archaeon]|nr:histidinol dehydrogenase [Candidatus Woesearchaeota archaeon]
MIQRISIGEKKKVSLIKERSKKDFSLALEKVAPIIKGIRLFKNKALFRYAKKYDCFEATKNNILVSEEEIKKAYKKVDEKTISAIRKAKENIKRYAGLQMPKGWESEISKGIRIGQLVKPLDSVGCYVPGGNFPLVSSVLMSVVPAKAAGVKNIIVCSPPKQDNWALYAACDIAGADKVYRIGGAQAIAAMAFGTETVPKVDKIVGPGNIFVTAAKKLVYGDVGIDFLAGPSEILIIAEKGNPKFIAADMIAQAEHDVLASSILVTTGKELAEKVEKELEKQLKELKRYSLAPQSLRKYGCIIVAGSLEEAVSFANDFAPEHLEIIVKEPEKVIRQLSNFGALFIGEYSPEAAGDYCSGTNHILPTGKASRFRAGLSVMDFIRMPSFQNLSKEGLKSLKESITALADAEGLEGHRKSVEKRF